MRIYFESLKKVEIRTGEYTEGEWESKFVKGVCAISIPDDVEHLEILLYDTFPGDTSIATYSDVRWIMIKD